MAYGNSNARGAAVSANAVVLDSILANSQGGVDLVNNAVNGQHVNTAAVILPGPNLVMSSTGAISGTVPLSANPQLGPLQNNGGPTPTMALPLGSPASGAGTSIAGVFTNQRGLLRPTSPPLGAFDPRATLPVTTTQLSSISILPNLFNSTAQMTVTVQVSNPGSVVDEGMVSVTVAGRSADGVVVNGMASVQLTVPLLTVAGNQTVSLAYADNSTSALFEPAARRRRRP